MENKIVSLKATKFTKMYKDFYSNIDNYNRSLMMVGTAPKSQYEIKNTKIS